MDGYVYDVVVNSIRDEVIGRLIGIKEEVPSMIYGAIGSVAAGTFLPCQIS